jgi:nucleoside 2-deoxyribosyltransferase
MLSVYFAGELFSLKHLFGNAALADSIAKLSKLRFLCVMPQTLENRGLGAHHIRDLDILTLLSCDLALFNFDGPELDSGTIVEFLFAKFADIPAVVLRTDFRQGGDQQGDPWNLMASFYPRTKTVCVDGMLLYKGFLSEGFAPVQAGQASIERVAEMVLAEFEVLRHLPPILTENLAEPVYRWLGRMPGFQATESIEKVMATLTQKRAKGLLPY